MEDLTICLSNGRADFGRYQRLFESLSVLRSPTKAAVLLGLGEAFSLHKSAGYK